VVVMSDGAVLQNQGPGWKPWKRLKAGVDPVAFAAKMRAAYDVRPAEFHAYIRALIAACDLEHRAQLDALVDQISEDPDAVWSLFDDPGYDLQIEDVARCCQARLALNVPRIAHERAASSGTCAVVKQFGVAGATYGSLARRPRLCGET
jgi:hypothetical protein